MTPVRPFASPIDAETGAPPRCLRLHRFALRPEARVMTHESRFMKHAPQAGCLAAQPPYNASTLAARMKSFSCRPAILCVKITTSA